MVNKPNKNEARLRRHRRVRGKISGTASCPRLDVFRSMDKGFEGIGSNIEAAKKVGLAVAKAAQEKGITKVVFDRGGYVYHGRVKALAEGAREGGLEL